MLPAADPDDVTAEIRRAFDDLERTLPGANRQSLGTWTPPVDVFETEERIEIIVDVSGVSPARLRVFFKGPILVIAGEKLPLAGGTPAATAYHLVEREFGRFARTVRLASAFDARAASARLRSGELRLTVPKLPDRRGQQIVVPITGRDTRP